MTLNYDLPVGQTGQGRLILRGGSLYLPGRSMSIAGTASTSGGTVEISDGNLQVGATCQVGGQSGWGYLEVEGSEASISFGGYLQKPRGKLLSVFDSNGISAILVGGSATLDGRWEVDDGGACPGRFTVLSAASISGSFDEVILPGPGWSWGIDSGKTLWVQTPEPASVAFIIAWAVPVLWRRRVPAAGRAGPTREGGT